MSKPFAFKIPKRSRINIDAFNPLSIESAPAAEETGLVQGQQVGSKEEWRVAKALDKYSITYVYQYRLFGGRSVRGGQVIDFLVYVPFAIPVQVHGDYWHSGQYAEDDKLKEAILESLYGRVVTFWGHELQSQEAANAAVRREFL